MKFASIPPRVPIEVPEATLRILPAGPPGDTRHDERCCLPHRRRPDFDECVAQRVVPVHAIREAGETARGQVELEREAPTRRPGRAKPVEPSVGTLGGADDPGGQVTEPCELMEVQCVLGANARLPDTRQLDPLQPSRIFLARSRERFKDKHLEVLQD